MMVLVDTSVWIDHLRAGVDGLRALLDDSAVLMHPFVRAELACGNLANRAALLSLLGALPQARVADDAEVLHFIERHRLMGRGIGYIDAHLLAATALSAPAVLWTHDSALRALAGELNLLH